ncbi:MAG: hypothetical protein C0625_08085 [Arcobacter sp.]|nr:MAG: hypothetical protein C0625_08085 [Arcobacter sp.]
MTYFILHNLLVFIEIFSEININYLVYVLSVFISSFFTVLKFYKEIKRLPFRRENLKISLFSLIPYWATSIPEQYILTGKINGQLRGESLVKDMPFDLILVEILMYSIYFIIIFIVFIIFFEINTKIVKKLEN